MNEITKKLRLLADWFDHKYPDNPNKEVQEDLRELANSLDKNKCPHCGKEN